MIYASPRGLTDRTLLKNVIIVKDSRIEGRISGETDGEKEKGRDRETKTRRDEKRERGRNVRSPLAVSPLRA